MLGRFRYLLLPEAIACHLTAKESVIDADWLMSSANQDGIWNLLEKGCQL